MGRTPCCSKVGLQRGAWSSDEDNLLIKHIQAHGEGQWRALPSKAGLLRCGKSCRLRWMNYLRPGIKRGNFTTDENDVITRLRSVHGNRWSLIATELPGRTDNEIKNHWNAHLRKAVAVDNHHSETPKNKRVKKKKKLHDNQKLETTNNVKLVDSQSHGSGSGSGSSSSSVTSSSTSSKNESFDNGTVTTGASSSCTLDLGDDELDFSWSDWTPFLEVEGTTSCTLIDGHQDECFLMDDCDLSIAKDDESLMLENLYREYLNLLNHQDDVNDEGN